jgi:protein-S-isoprenylcysteine O-methyltransferase Ste14
VTRSLRRLLLSAGIWYLVGALEGVEALRQGRREIDRTPATSAAHSDLLARLVALPWWPAGVAALAEAALLPRLNGGQKWDKPCLVAGIAVTGTGIVLRQWAIRSLGQYFVCRVLVQPGQTVVSSGPYRWLRHPSYTGLWLEMVGVGLSTGNAASIATCAVMPLITITARINGEERQLIASLPGYREYIQGRPRLVPHIW